MDEIHPLVKVALALAIVVLVIFFLVYRKEETIVVEGRWWDSVTRVKYDETDWVTECTPETVCTGYGDDRTCRTETDCRLVSKTTTYTRCSAGASGDSLPVIYPDAPCAMWPGDYVRHSSTFYVSYHQQEENETRHSPFQNGLWDSFESRYVVKVKKNILGIIVWAEVKQRPI